MRDCEALRDELKAYLDRELSAFRRWVVHRHLASCPSCQEEVREMQRLSQEFHSAENGALDPALRARILNALPASPPEMSKRPIGYVPRRMAAVGAALTLVLIGVVSYPVVMKLVNNYPSASDSRSMMPSPNVPQMTAGGSPPSASYAESPVARKGQPQSPLSKTEPKQTNSPHSDGHAKWSIEDRSHNNGRSRTPSDTVLVQPELHKQPVVGPGVASGGATLGGIPGATSEKKDESPPAPGNLTEESIKDSMRPLTRRAELTLVVPDAAKEAESIGKLVRDTGGVASSPTRVDAEGGGNLLEITIQAPADRFDSLLQELKKRGEVTSSSIAGDDVADALRESQEKARRSRGIAKPNELSSAAKPPATRADAGKKEAKEALDGPAPDSHDKKQSNRSESKRFQDLKRDTTTYRF